MSEVSFSAYWMVAGSVGPGARVLPPYLHKKMGCLFCWPSREDDDEEYAERLNEGFGLIGEEHHEQTIGKCKYRVCHWSEWTY